MMYYILVLSVAGASPVFAQDQCDMWDLATEKLMQPAAMVDTIRFGVVKAPEKAVRTTQATATGPASATASVASPERPRWVALAIEQGVGAENDNGGVTLSLSPFDWLSATKQDGYFNDNGNYVATMAMRRWTGSLNLGSRGESLDIDGDGVPEAPANAKSLGDSLTLEVQFQFFGNRDRRDLGKLGVYDARIEAIRNEADNLAEYLVDSIRAIPVYADRFDELNREVEAKRITCAKAADLLVESIQPERVAEFRRRSVTFRELTEELVSRIDGSFVWSVAVNATERKRYLGRDQLGISLRGLKGIVGDKMFGGSTFVFNFDYLKIDSLVENQSDLRAVKVGVEYVSGFDVLRLRNAEAAKWAVSLTGEKNWNAPADAKKSQAEIGWRMEIPISKDVTVPISIKWSNRDELLRDEDTVVGHIGVSLSFDSLLGK